VVLDSKYDSAWGGWWFNEVPWVVWGGALEEYQKGLWGVF
jgi:hypothetical protein